MALISTYFLLISKKDIILKNDFAEPVLSCSINKRFWQEKYDIVDNKTGENWIIENSVKKCNIYGNSLSLLLSFVYSYKYFKFELFDLTNEIDIVYQERTINLVKNGDKVLAKIRKIESDSILDIVRGANSWVFKLTVYDDQIELRNLMFYCLSALLQSQIS